jgi:cytochrome c551
MKKKLLAIVFGSFLVISACGGGGDDADNTDQPSGNGETASADGEAIFQQSCVSCHGKDLSGGGGPALTGVGDKYSEEEIQDIIVNGKGGMPGGIVKGEDAQAVAQWLATQ